MAQSRDSSTDQETAAALLRQQWEERRDTAKSSQGPVEGPVWREVQRRLGNDHLQAILNHQATSSVEIYLRHLLEVESQQGLDTGPYLPWRAPPSWSNWIQPYYEVLETESGQRTDLQGQSSEPEEGPSLSLVSRDLLDSSNNSEDFLLDWFNATLKRTGGGRSPTLQERAIMEHVHGPLPKGMRFHDGSAAQEAAQGVQAKAFALGTDIYFASRPDPSTPDGAELLVHEATHVKQAVEGRLPSKTGEGLQVSSPSDPHEQEAYAAGALGRQLAAKKHSWGLHSVGEIEPAGAAILDQLGLELPEKEDWGASAYSNTESTPTEPDRSPLLRDGSGEWGTESCEPDDYAVWLAFQEISSHAELLGLTNAARHMRHYLGNSGGALQVNVDLMIRDLPRLEQRFQEFEQEAFIAATLLLDELDTTVEQFVEMDNSDRKQSDIYAYKEDSMDWFFATGGFTHWWSASAHYTPDEGTQQYNETGSLTLFVRLHYFDVYNWDKGKSVTLPVIGVTIEDEVLQELHQCGIAKEFDRHGTTSDRVFERRYEASRNAWSTEGQGEALNPDGADSRDGGRSDPSRTTVQYKTEGRRPKNSVEKASAGLSSASSPLPHRSRIQASFGTHDVSDIKAQVGGDAGETADALGARAYASGDRVAFQQGKDDLHTAAHEAAHVIQQASGKIAPGESKPGDEQERHADAVADKVVAGESAQQLLDEYSNPGIQQAPKALQRKEGGGGSTHSSTLSALTTGLSATSSDGQAYLSNPPGNGPELASQKATEDRSEKVDRFETGVDHNLDELEDYEAFDQLIEAIEDGESTRSALNSLKRTNAFKTLAEQWQSALSDQKDGAKMRQIFNREYDGRGFWAETEQAFALVANAAKRHARPDPKAAGADATLSSLANQTPPTETTASSDADGGTPTGQVNALPNLEAVPENIQALLGATVSLEPASIDSYTKMESLQTEYGNIHSAYGSRDTLTQQAEVQANERGRVSEVFSTFAEGFGSGFVQGALEGTTDGIVWDTLTSYGDSLIKNSSSGQMPPVIGPAFELVTSFGLYPGAEFDPTAGIGGDSGDLAQMGNTFSDLSMNSQALLSGEYSGTDQLGILIATFADALQLTKEIIDLVNKVLGILSALLYVIAGVLIAIGIAFCWCGMAFLIPIGNQLIPIATMLSNFCKLLGPISMAISVVIPLLRMMAAIFVPQELYARQLELTASTSESLGSTTGSKLADNTVQNAKDRIATRNNPVGVDQENPASAERVGGEEEGLQTAQDLDSTHQTGSAELDAEIQRHDDTENNSQESDSTPKTRAQEAIDITKAALDPRNFTKAMGQTSKAIFVEPFQKISDPNYFGTTLRESLDQGTRTHEQEMG
ncbi:MAG: DUF4157 domain-containing protein, partial [Myxococcota bacterium]|nr:DUF4157 domain-containing protein [Myxococcota bacterium]